MRPWVLQFGVCFLAGCFYIDDQDEQDRLALLEDPAGDLLLRVTAVDPVVVAGCQDTAEIAVTAAVSGEFENTEFDLVVTVDDGAPVPLGTVTSGPDVGGEAGLQAVFTIDVPEPLDSCLAGDACKHEVTLTLDGAGVQASKAGVLYVTPDAGPSRVDGTVDEGALVDAVGDNPADTVVSEGTSLHLRVPDPWLAQYPDGVEVTVYGCPEGTLIDDATACTLTREAQVGAKGDSGALVAEVPLAGLETSCLDAPLDWFVQVTGHACDDSVVLPLAVGLRFGDDDCDDDNATVDDGDCDDADPVFGPDVDEDCATTVDEDCDGDANTASVPNADTVTGYVDADGDTFGAAGGTEYCELPAGAVTTGDDCDDDDDTSFPGGDEVCDGADNDCNTTADDGQIWYVDNDDDGYGVGVSSNTSCTAGSTDAPLPGDCDDADQAITPVGQVWFVDADDDGFGGATSANTTCTAGATDVRGGGDCDDTSKFALPGGVEDRGVVCFDGLDNDCSGTKDDAACGTCDDDLQNPTHGESDVDCGVGCIGCATDESCDTDSDCASGQCATGNVCDEWTVWAAGPLNEERSRVAVGDDGTVVVAFQTASATLAIGGKSVSGTAGQVDVVLARLDQDGDAVWLQRFGSAANDVVDAVALDTDGSVLLSGRMMGTASLGSESLAAGDGFLMRILPDGAIDWVDVQSKVNFYDIDVRPDGRIAAVGSVDEPVSTTDALLHIVERDGTTVDDVTMIGNCPDRLVAVEWAGTELIVAGSFGIDTGWSGHCKLPVDATHELDSTYGSDSFVARLEANPRTALWVAQIEGTLTAGNDSQLVRAMAVDAAGNVFVAGTSWGGGTVGAVAYPLETGHAQEDLMLVRIDADGTPAWAERGGSQYQDYWSGLELDGDGNLVAIGGVQVLSPTPVDIDAGTVTAVFLMDAVMGAFDPATGAGRGATVWPGPNGGEYVYTMAKNSRGNLVFSGIVTNPNFQFDFGAGGGWDVGGGFGLFVVSAGRRPW